MASAIVGLPHDFRLSGLLTLGSGLPFTQFVCPTASNPDICWNGGRPEKHSFIIPNAWAFRQLDLRLSKTFEIMDGNSVEFTFDAINVLNFANYSAFEQCFCAGPNYGQPRDQYLPTRSFQLGLRYRW